MDLGFMCKAIGTIVPYCDYIDQFNSGNAEAMYAVNTKKVYKITHNTYDDKISY